MKPINLQRHVTCNYYSENQEHGATYINVALETREAIELNSGDSMILLFVSGRDTRYSIEGEDQAPQTAPFGIFLDNHKSLHLSVGEPSRVAIFKFEKAEELCNNFSISSLKAYAPTTMVHRTLEIYEPLRVCLDTMQRYYDDGLTCECMMQLKLQEVFWIIGGYYDPAIIGEVFSAMLSREVDFKSFVIANFIKAKAVQDLADMRGVSLRTFNKEFKENFGKPPYTWMLEQRAKLIEERLADPSISFQEIMEEFGLSSPSHFTVFCRRLYGKTPTQRRRELLKEQAEARAAAKRAEQMKS